jgi:hypothetical protein
VYENTDLVLGRRGSCCGRDIAGGASGHAGCPYPQDFCGDISFRHNHQLLFRLLFPRYRLLLKPFFLILVHFLFFFNIFIFLSLILPSSRLSSYFSSSLCLRFLFLRPDSFLLYYCHYHSHFLAYSFSSVVIFVLIICLYILSVIIVMIVLMLLFL